MLETQPDTRMEIDSGAEPHPPWNKPSVACLYQIGALFGRVDEVKARFCVRELATEERPTNERPV